MVPCRMLWLLGLCRCSLGPRGPPHTCSPRKQQMSGLLCHRSPRSCPGAVWRASCVFRALGQMAGCGQGWTEDASRPPCQHWIHRHVWHVYLCGLKPINVPFIGGGFYSSWLLMWCCKHLTVKIESCLRRLFLGVSKGNVCDIVTKMYNKEHLFTYSWGNVSAKCNAAPLGNSRWLKCVSRGQNKAENCSVVSCLGW